MSIHTPKKPSRVNAVSVTIFLVVAALGYFAWTFVPPYYNAWRLTGAMMSAARAAYREYDDQKLIERLVLDGKRAGLQVTRDNFALQREPYPEEDLIQQSDHARTLLRQRGRKMTITFALTIEAKWPFLDKVTPINFENVREADLTTESW